MRTLVFAASLALASSIPNTGHAQMMHRGPSGFEHGGFRGDGRFFRRDHDFFRDRFFFRDRGFFRDRFFFSFGFPGPYYPPAYAPAYYYPPPYYCGPYYPCPYPPY
jgi:hypothetical protein